MTQYEYPSLDLFVHGLAALAKATTPGYQQGSLLNELQGMLEVYDAVQQRSFTQLLRQAGSWSVENASDLRDHKDTIVQLSNWVVRSDREWPQRTEIRPSMLGPSAGYGLFATRRLPVSKEDRHIASYGGHRYASEAEFEELTGTTLKESLSEYIIADAEHGIVDGELGFHLDEQGRWANTRRSKAECNAKFKWTEGGDQIWLWVRKGNVIEPGEEIYVWYSDEFAAYLYGGGPASSSSSPKRLRTGQEDVAIEAALCRLCISAPADRVCGGCQGIQYCSERCAARHWERGGHHVECEMLE